MPTFTPVYAPAAFEANVLTDLYVNGDDNAAIVRLCQATNTGASAMEVEVWITDASNTIRSTLLLPQSVAAGANAVNTDMHFLPTGYKIRFKCSSTSMTLEASVVGGA